MSVPADTSSGRDAPGPTEGPEPAVDPAQGGTADAVVAVDGRTARAERTRTAIVDALLGLLEEGELQPPASRIAERAGISLRLIYHHFGDLESLFRATADRQAARSREMAVAIDPTLPFEDRLDQFCEQRGRFLEWMTPVRRAALLYEPFSSELTKARTGFRQVGEAEIARVFGAEIARFDEPDDAEVLTALHAVTGWGTWEAIRSGGTDEEAAVGVMRRAVRSILHPQER